MLEEIFARLPKIVMRGIVGKHSALLQMSEADE